MQPQKAPNLLFLITIERLQLGHLGLFIFDFACLEQTGMPLELDFDASLPHSAHFIGIRMSERSKRI